MVEKNLIAGQSLQDDLYTRVKALYSDLHYVWGEINGFTKWDTWEEFTKNLDLIRDLYPRVVACVEYCSNKIYEETKLLCSSAEKKAAAKQFFDELIVLSGLGEWFSDLLIDWGVEAAVKALNAKYGKDWGLDDKNAVIARAASILNTPKTAKVENEGR
jgi:hypothetical protein